MISLIDGPTSDLQRFKRMLRPFSCMLDDPPNLLKQFCDISYLIFIMVYISEAILKILFYRKDYFNDGCNIYDFTFAILSLVLTLLQWFIDNNYVGILLITCRVLKVCCLFKKIKTSI